MRLRRIAWGIGVFFRLKRHRLSRRLGEFRFVHASGVGGVARFWVSDTIPVLLAVFSAGLRVRFRLCFR